MTHLPDTESTWPTTEMKTDADRAGRLARLSGPCVELLESRGGFQFATLCLWLVFLAIGLLFHRSFNADLFGNEDIENFVHVTGPGIVLELEDLMAGLAVSETVEKAIPLSGLADRIARISGESTRLILQDAASDPPDLLSEDMARSAAETAEALSALGRLAAELANSQQSSGGPSDRRHFHDEVSSAKDALTRHLHAMARVDQAREAGTISRIRIMSVWFWVFLIASLIVGSAFLRLLRDEVVARRARQTAERKANFLAYYDPATGLANRHQFQDRLTGLVARDIPVSVVMIDINDFKEFNERHGRLAGDVVVKEIAYRIRSVAERCSGFPARLGGDDFSLVLLGREAEQPGSVADAILSECRKPILRAGQSYSVQVSVGCVPQSVLTDGDHLTYERIMRAVDFALETARRQTSSAVVVYDTEMANAFEDRRRLVEQLPNAIAARELLVFFQPQFNIAASEVYGFEALVRWGGGGRAVPPLELVRLAEQSGLIEDLDHYVLSEAVGVVADWNRRHRKDFHVSANLSAVHLARAGTADFIRDCLRRSGLRPDALTIEITESVELENDDQARETLARIAALGCRISIDDFGTGYSSFGYLHSIRADEIKIDRSFVTDIETSPLARDILRTLVNLTKCIGRSVVVEGIETEAQARILAELGCSRVQGFLYGKPRPALEWLADTTYGPRSVTTNVKQGGASALVSGG